LNSGPHACYTGDLLSFSQPLIQEFVTSALQSQVEVEMKVKVEFPCRLLAPASEGFPVSLTSACLLFAAWQCCPPLSGTVAFLQLTQLPLTPSS
jgi:hypothetical protein